MSKCPCGAPVTTQGMSIRDESGKEWHTYIHGEITGEAAIHRTDGRTIEMFAFKPEPHRIVLWESPDDLVIQ